MRCCCFSTNRQQGFPEFTRSGIKRCAPRTERQPCAVLVALWRGRAEWPWFGALLMPGEVMSENSPFANFQNKFPLDDDSWNSIADQLALSPRQTLVVRLILSDLGNNEISAFLGITVPTVRSHLKQVYARTSTTDRVSLILKVFNMYHESVSNNDVVKEGTSLYSFERFAS